MKEQDHIDHSWQEEIQSLAPSLANIQCTSPCDNVPYRYFENLEAKVRYKISNQKQRNWFENLLEVITLKRVILTEIALAACIAFVALNPFNKNQELPLQEVNFEQELAMLMNEEDDNFSHHKHYTKPTLNITLANTSDTIPEPVVLPKPVSKPLPNTKINEKTIDFNLDQLLNDENLEWLEDELNEENYINVDEI